MEKTLVFGHQKPDTDTVTSAIVLSYLKNKLGENTEPRVLGSLNNETKFVLDYFGVDEPKYLSDVRLQIKDIDYSKGCFLNEYDSIFKAYNYMNKHKIGTLPVVNKLGKYVGAVSMKNITADLIDGEIGNLETSYDNILEAVKGEEVLCFHKTIKGDIIVPSYNSASFKDLIKIDNHSVLIVGDRHSIIEYAISNKASAIILTNGVKLTEDVLKKAEVNKVDIISTKFDGITSSNLIVLCNFIKNKLIDENIITINENDSLYDVMEIANKKKFNNYPVLNNDGTCLGVFRANVTDNKHPKKVILVDHNEVEQSAVGLNEADIVEIVDHHKIGNIGTMAPINFRNMPVGCTQTILYSLFKENNVSIPRKIAGLMLSGIISDTLLLSSPTTTNYDREAIEKLAKIAKIDLEKYAIDMFKAGSNLNGKSINEIIHLDFKNFNVDNQKIGIGQISTMTTDDVLSKKDEFIRNLDDIASSEDYVAIALFVTDIIKNGSYILFNSKAKNIFAGAFNVDIEQGYFFEGLVSRKKQVVPKVMNYMDNK